MTREEQLDWLCRLRSKIYVYTPKEWLIPMNDALDMATKALEQEPILDKIRAEIEEYKSRQLTLAIGVNDLEKGKQIALEYVLEVLDKYRAESESEE